MSPARLLEIVAWSAGILLVATYFGIRAWSTQAADRGIESQRQWRTQEAVQLDGNESPTSSAHTANPHKRLVAREPDLSLWNSKRIARYRAALLYQAMPLAVLRVPRLELEVPVYEGTSDLTLNRGAGRISGTAAVEDESGNIGIAAHRDGFFRPLKDIQVGDAVFLETVDATREYRVRRLQIVDPDQVGVLAATGRSEITLVTCYPFYFVGPAPQRFIVHARAIEDAGQ